MTLKSVRSSPVKKFKLILQTVRAISTFPTEKIFLLSIVKYTLYPSCALNIGSALDEAI